MKITFIEREIPQAGILVVGITSKNLDQFQAEIDKETGGLLSRALHDENFDLSKGAIASIPYPHGLKVDKLVLLGIKTSETLTSLDLEKIGARIWGSFEKAQCKEACIYLPALPIDLVKGAESAYVANGLVLKSWRFDKYHTKKQKKERCAIKTVNFLVEDTKSVKGTYEPLKAVTQGVFWTRDLVTEPANVLYPETFAQQLTSLTDMGIRVDILDKKEMASLGMNALLGVSLGSAKEPKLVVLQWNGGEKGQAPIAFVGKGVTFDTGGISIKPSQDMDLMKGDMAGAAALAGLMKALAGRKAKVNVVSVLGLVENMPDGKAQRPGDIVTSMSGQTIEILNTDAEGRLVLADALWYAQDKFKPQAMIDIATLTGAITVSLGVHYAGLFSNDDLLAKGLLKAGLETGEKLWRLPLGDEYNKDIDSEIADVKNLGSGPGAGSITAAQFLQRFTDETKWAHVDIAATAWVKKPKDLTTTGATAIGVRLFNQWLQDNFG